MILFLSFSSTNNVRFIFRIEIPFPYFVGSFWSFKKTDLQFFFFSKMSSYGLGYWSYLKVIKIMFATFFITRKWIYQRRNISACLSQNRTFNRSFCCFGEKGLMPLKWYVNVNGVHDQHFRHLKALKTLCTLTGFFFIDITPFVLAMKRL